MNKTCFVSIDVEEDFLNGRTVDSFYGVKELENLLEVWEKFNVHVTLFCTGKVIANFADSLKKYQNKGHEIALHGFYDHVNLQDQTDKKIKLNKHIELFKNIIGFSPIGFRAVQNTVDNQALEILEEAGLRYDSSVISNYPFGKKYIGYKGRSPQTPYFPKLDNYLQTGERKILEIPLNPLVLGVQLQGKWIRDLGVGIIKTLLRLKKPDLLSLSFHSWDLLDDKSIKNGGKEFISRFVKILKYLDKNSYKFLNGQEIYKVRGKYVQ